MQREVHSLPLFINPLHSLGGGYNNGMYLEMLYNRYGSELEKQAMEKQALNPRQLIQLGRGFAARGKMDRFSQLINKRNNIIRNTNVFANRQRLNDKLRDKALVEYDWLGHADGPVYKQYKAAYKRSPAYRLTQDYLHTLSNEQPGNFLEMIDLPHPMGEASPNVLANWSSKLHNMGL